MVTALKRFIDADEEKRREGWLMKVNEMAEGLGALDGVEVTLVDGGAIPSAHVNLKTGDGKTVTHRLNAGDPSVHVNASRVNEDVLVLNPVCLRDGDVLALVDAFETALS